MRPKTMENGSQRELPKGMFLVFAVLLILKDILNKTLTFALERDPKTSPRNCQKSQKIEVAENTQKMFQNGHQG